MDKAHVQLIVKQTMVSDAALEVIASLALQEVKANTTITYFTFFFFAFCCCSSFITYPQKMYERQCQSITTAFNFSVSSV